MNHQMNLKPAPFVMIKNGEKTIELRLNDEKRQIVQPGDKITFTNTDTGEVLTATVKALYRFSSFAELYEALPLLKCGYTEQDIDTAKASDMDIYYPAEKQTQYGVVGIELSVDL